VRVRIVPGVTAAQAAASRVGAPLGHDYCVLSLSDRLKPWEIIEKRLDAAGAADLVLALYNPASQSRTTQLAEARDVLLRHRAPATPVVVALAPGGQPTPVPRSFLGVSTEYWSLPLYARHLTALARVLGMLRAPGDGPLIVRVGGASADRRPWLRCRTARIFPICGRPGALPGAPIGRCAVASPTSRASCGLSTVASDPETGPNTP